MQFKATLSNGRKVEIGTRANETVFFLALNSVFGYPVEGHSVESVQAVRASGNHEWKKCEATYKQALSFILKKL